MGKPSEKALRTAVLAPEHVSPHTPNLDTVNESLVALAQALKDRIGVLQILDGTAPEWPGIQACMESMVELAQDVSQQLQASRDTQEKAAADVFVKESKIRQLEGQLAENADALAAAEDEATRTLEEHQQVNQQLNTCKQNMEQLQIQHEHKCEELRVKLGTAERTVAELRTECKQLKQHLEFQEAEMATLKQAAAKQLDELVEAREDLAANGADLERQTQLAARHSADLTMARRKLHDSTAALAEARSAVAVLRGGAEHGAAALQREQREVAALQAALGAARQEASRAKHLRDAQATASKDKLQEHEAAAAQRHRALEQQLAARDTAAATLRSELKAATEAAAERVQAQHAQQRAAQLQAQELADAKLRARELMAEVGKLRESAAEAQAAQQALRSKADKCAQEATAAQEARQALAERIRGECREEQQALRRQLQEAQQDLAIKASLADSWQREVQGLCKRLEQADQDRAQLQGLNRLLSKQLDEAAAAARAAAAAPAAAVEREPAGPEGEIKELRTELRAFASHLTAQQLGALAHLSAARSHTFPGGPHGRASPGIDWSPVLWGVGSDARAPPPRRRVLLPRVPAGPQNPAASGQTEITHGHVDRAPRLYTGGGPYNRLDDPDRSAMQTKHSGAEAAPREAASMRLDTRGAVEPPAQDVTRAAASRHARRRRSAPEAQTLGALRRAPAARGDGVRRKQGCTGGNGVRGSPAHACIPLQDGGLGQKRAGRSQACPDSRTSQRSVSEQERALEQELERIKERMAARAAAGALPGHQAAVWQERPSGKVKPVCDRRPGKTGKKSVTIPTVW